LKISTIFGAELPIYRRHLMGSGPRPAIRRVGLTTLLIGQQSPTNKDKRARRPPAAGESMFATQKLTVNGITTTHARAAAA
jgi:hypothetical protein